MKRKFPISRVILLALAGVVLGLSLYNWNSKTLAGNRMPMPFGCGFSVVLTGSMEPALEAGDLVIVRRAERVAVGDIVVFQSGNVLVVHRVVAVEGNCITTQGDANNMADDPISLADVKGRVVATVPKAGKALRRLQQPPVVIALLLAALIPAELSYRKEKRQREAELETIEKQIQSLMQQIRDDGSQG